MPRVIVRYVRIVDAINRRVGRVTMYGIFVLAAVLLWSSLSKVLSEEPFSLLDSPSPWTFEMAQFAMVAYYILGGPYSLQLGDNVRMDLFYNEWTPRTKAWVDSFTVLFLLFYLAILFYGGLVSAAYSLGHFQGEPFAFFADLAVAFVTGGTSGVEEHLGFLERSPTAWRPYLWPIKVLMCVGIFLMMLQAVAEFCRDIARIRGTEI